MSEPRQPGRVKWSLVLPLVTLGIAVALQGLSLFRETARPRGKHLGQFVASDLPGWQSRDVPLGANEFQSGVAEKVLNYDEFVYREFSRAGESFGVYVAYWGAGKMPTRLVASHTPDRCWTENGWHCLQMKFKVAEEIRGTPLQPAEWRVFEPPSGGAPTYVLFWHLVEGQPYDYGERFNNVPSPVLWWKDAMQQAVMGSREQYFIRLTSSAPLENLWADPGFGEILRGLGRLGLAPAQGGRTGKS